MATISWEDFDKVEMRVGTIISAQEFRQAKKPAYTLTIDLGPGIGIKQSSSQLTKGYTREELLGTQVICVTNFTPIRIAGYKSEVLVTGLVMEGGEVILSRPDKPVPNGTRLA